jgi:hypothetical protein
MFLNKKNIIIMFLIFLVVYLYFKLKIINTDNFVPLTTDDTEKIKNIIIDFSNKKLSDKLLEEGRHNFQLFPNPSYKQENRKKSSERMMGNTYGLGRIMTDETKNKIAEGVKGNTNVRNTKWWNNGNERKRSKICPGEGWKEGFQIN